MYSTVVYWVGASAWHFLLVRVRVRVRDGDGLESIRDSIFDLSDVHAKRSPIQSLTLVFVVVVSTKEVWCELKYIRTYHE